MRYKKTIIGFVITGLITAGVVFGAGTEQAQWLQSGNRTAFDTPSTYLEKGQYAETLEGGYYWVNENGVIKSVPIDYDVSKLTQVHATGFTYYRLFKDSSNKFYEDTITKTDYDTVEKQNGKPSKEILSIGGVPVSAAIAFDTSSSARNSTGNSLTFAHTSTGSNLILIVGTSVQDSNHANFPVTGITYNTVALTKIRSDEATGNNGTELWYLINPSTGNNNIVITVTGSLGELAGFGTTLTGAKQSAQPDAQNGQNGSGFAAALSITTIADNAWTFHVFSTEAGITGVTNGTEIGPLTDQSFENAAADYRGPLTPAGVFATGFNMASGQSYAQSGASFAPAAAAAINEADLEVNTNLQIKSGVLQIK